jgi:8-oxo-dGTP pyrophosphatase MutT (NUDIX family)
MFKDDRSLLMRKYDFITCCEVFEHFHRPYVELIKLFNLMKPGAILGIKTSLVEEGADYAKWHYTNDLSHVVFLRRETVDWIARRFSMSVCLLDRACVVLRKDDAPVPVRVAAGIIEYDGAMLAAMRDDDGHSGQWEFPGGKLNEGEDPLSALEREILEELSLKVTASGVSASMVLPIARKWIELIIVRAKAETGRFTLRCHSCARWCTTEDLFNLPMLDGDRAYLDIYLG